MIRLRTLRGRLAAWIAASVMAAGVFHAGAMVLLYVTHERREAELYGEVEAEEAEELLVVAEGIVGSAALVAVLVAVAAAGVGVLLARKAIAPLREAAEHLRRAARAGAGDVRLQPRGMEEWDELAAAVNETLGLQQRTIERARTFSANAAHELRTPLAALLGEVQVTLRRERTPGEYREALAGVEQDVIRLADVVAALLTLSRSDSGELRVQAGTLDVAALAAEAARLPAGAREGRFVAPPEAVLAHGDALLTRQILANLVDNARRHGGPDVEVRVDVLEGAVAVTVSDDGPGLTPEVRARLFERFNRVQGGVEGHGLGLAIAHALATSQRGTLRLGEGPGRTRFILELPRS